MFKKLLIGFAVIVLIGGGVYVALGQPAIGAAEAQSLQTPTAAPVEANNDIIAEGRVVPADDAALSFAIGGLVDQVLVAEGDRVEQGQLIAQLKTDRLSVALKEAEANLTAAEAALAKAQRGPSAEDIEVAAANVEVARTGVLSAQAAVKNAQANLAQLQAGPTAEEVAIAERRVAEAKNALWANQAQRDAICGRVGKGAQDADCDAAEAAIHRAEEEVGIAELQLQQLKAGPQAAEVAAAQAQVEQALGQLATAQAQVKRAETELTCAKKGPATEDIAVAAAQVEQAQAAVESARAAMADAELRAPLSGTVVSLDAKVGEYVTPGNPIAQVADLTTWQVETTDLSELNVVNIAVGDPVQVALDALPDLELGGHVARIVELGQMERGEIVYRVLITLDEQHPQLHWNMTAAVTITPEQ